MGYFASMRTTACINRFTDHHGHTHHVLGTTGGQQGAPDEMQTFSMTLHPIWGRVLRRHSTARAAAFADDAYIYDRLHSALKVFVDIRQRLTEDANLHMNLNECQIYIPGVSLERAHELVRQKLDQDSSLASLSDILAPSANVITVTGMRCVGVPIGIPEFVTAYVRAKAVEIGNDVQKLSIITDAKIHYDLLRFCQHTRLGFLNRALPPEVMMTSTNGVFSSGVCQALRKSKIQDWGSGMFDMVGPSHVQERITHAILQRGLGGSFDRKPAADKEWCRMIVELPHHRGGLAITP